MKAMSDKQPNEVLLREPIWNLELNNYQRENLLVALEKEATDTGDWHGEIRLMLERHHEIERVYRR